MMSGRGSSVNQTLQPQKVSSQTEIILGRALAPFWKDYMDAVLGFLRTQSTSILTPDCCPHQAARK